MLVNFMRLAGFSNGELNAPGAFSIAVTQNTFSVFFSDRHGSKSVEAKESQRVVDIS